MFITISSQTGHQRRVRKAKGKMRLQERIAKEEYSRLMEKKLATVATNIIHCLLFHPNLNEEHGGEKSMYSSN